MKLIQLLLNGTTFVFILFALMLFGTQSPIAVTKIDSPIKSIPSTVFESFKLEFNFAILAMEL